MFTPSNIDDYYSKLDEKILQQGDVLRATSIGLKDEKQQTSPDFWIVITKDCDLVLEKNNTVRKSTLSLLPVISLKVLDQIGKRDAANAIRRSFNRVVLAAVMPLFGKFLKLKPNQIESLLENKISKFMFLPPDGKILTEPMVVDFDLLTSLNGADPDIVNQVRDAKVLQLSSPFRQKIAERFAKHFADIGINDDEVRSPIYKKNVKDEFQKRQS